MNFLLSNSTKIRTTLQLEGFLNTSHLHFIKLFWSIENFKLPTISEKNKTVDDIIPKNLRLGNRLEYLFDYVISKTTDFDIVAKNIQIVANKITIGELDFILKDLLTSELIHVEIANKFYLHDESMENEYSKWIGPNRNDNLFLKLSKMKMKQFPLLHHSATKKKLQELQIETKNISQKINLKAQLFLPFENLPIPLLSKNNITGYYVNLRQFQEEDFKKYQYFLPEKQDWQVDPKHGEIWVNYNTIFESVLFHFQTKKSPLIWVKKSTISFEKIFVVWW